MIFCSRQVSRISILDRIYGNFKKIPIRSLIFFLFWDYALGYRLVPVSKEIRIIGVLFWDSEESGKRYGESRIRYQASRIESIGQLLTEIF